MRKNNLFTKSYFIKRLIEAGYIVYRVVDRYSDIDDRYWTINVLSRTGQQCLITCVKPDSNNYYFRINGPNDSNIRLEGLSMNLIYETIENIFKGIDVLNIKLEN